MQSQGSEKEQPKVAKFVQKSELVLLYEGP